MKLSDVKGERVFDVIADIIDPIASIASDETASAMFRREKCPEGMTAAQFVAERVRKSAPVLLKTYKHDIVTILSAIEGTDPKEYADSLNLAKLLRDAAELLTDSTFLELFTSAQSKKTGTPSGSARANTKGRKE